MPRLRYFDPDMLESVTTGISSTQPPEENSQSGFSPHDEGNLYSVQLAAIREFQQTYPMDTRLLEDNRVLGRSVRELSQPSGLHPGNVSRRLRRIATRFKVHVLAHLMAFLIQHDAGFTLCPSTATLAVRDDVYAVGLSEFGMDFSAAPSPADCLTYVQSVWRALESLDHRCIDNVVRPRFLGGWAYEGRFWLDVSILVADRTTAIHRASLERQRCIFNLMTDESILL